MDRPDIQGFHSAFFILFILFILPIHVNKSKERRQFERERGG
jgi:hypothetical protein